jgi:iron complex outermembrane receptor protein
LPPAPRWIANWTARYAVPSRGGEVFFFTDWAYRSRINFFLYESAEFQDGHERIGGARVGWRRDDGWELSAFGRNILNDVSIAGAIDFNNFSGYVNEPPLWGVEISRRF